MVVVQSDSSSLQPKKPATPSYASGSMNKESGPVGLTPDFSVGLRDAVPEIDMPKEVVAAGVSAMPTIVPIPTPVSQLGVQTTGTNVSPTSQTCTLPMTDDQIEIGLHKKIGNSARWLAEWCLRQLKKMHVSIKKNGPAWVRVRE
jgi:hypothetical protein